MLVLIRERTQITRQLLDKLPKLRLIAQTEAVGPHIDLDACTEHGMAVAESKGSPVAPTELTWALILAAIRRLPRAATAFEQEAIATLILSGRFVGFLPDHYAEAFVQRGQMRAVNSALLHYACDFVSVLRRSPQPSRAAQAFHQCLLQAHGVN